MARTEAQLKEYLREWYRRNSAKVAEDTWRNRLARNFGLTPEEYWALFAKQDGACAICRKAPTRMRLAVDHDHKTGAIRGLLCGSCNRSLGLLEDQPETFERAAGYLRTSHADYRRNHPHKK